MGVVIEPRQLMLGYDKLNHKVVIRIQGSRQALQVAISHGQANDLIRQLQDLIAQYDLGPDGKIVVP